MLYAALKKNLPQQIPPESSPSSHREDRSEETEDLSDLEYLVDSVPLDNQNTEVLKPTSVITEEEAQMAVCLTEYFQEQRIVYEQVKF